jgi:hypothetical protein
METFNPVGSWQGCLEEKGTHNVINRGNDAFNLTILGGVGT